MQRVRHPLYCIDRAFRCSDIRPRGSVLRSADPLSPPRACFNTPIAKTPGRDRRSSFGKRFDYAHLKVGETYSCNMI